MLENKFLIWEKQAVFHCDCCKEEKNVFYINYGLVIISKLEMAIQNRFKILNEISIREFICRWSQLRICEECREDKSPIEFLLQFENLLSRKECIKILSE